MNTTQITLVGNLTREPDLRFGASGSAFTTLGLAATHRYQRNGEWQEETTFIDVKLFGALAENAAASLDKGHRVVVSGRLKQETWEAKDGTKRTSFVVLADEVALSFRHARAQVERIVRETNQSAQRQDPIYGDEEPF